MVKISEMVEENIENQENKLSSKAILHEFCSRKHWTPPVFECVNDQGPSHRKLYSFKVIVEAEAEEEEASTTILECYGHPQRSKRAAAENAAFAAIWCLKNIGYQL